jgi:hypothetical protein
MYPNYGDWLLKACLRVGFKARIVKEAYGAASAFAFCRGGFWGGRGQRAAAEDPRQECAFPGLALEEAAYPALGKKQP